METRTDENKGVDTRNAEKQLGADENRDLQMVSEAKERIEDLISEAIAEDEGDIENVSARSKGRRCTIDLTPAASAEVDRMCGTYHLKIAELFRYGLLLMRIYGDAMKEGKQMRLVSRKDPNEVQVVELPLFI